MDRLHEIKKPRDIVNVMMSKDEFSSWMDLKVVSIEKGNCSLSCLIRKEMLNGFSIAHGGIAYSLADSTLAFAANSHGYQSFSIETSISHLVKVNEGDSLTSVSKEIHRGNKTALYHIDVYNQQSKLVAIMKGTVYISKIVW
jgi:acyl-CoA thioesterase